MSTELDALFLSDEYRDYIEEKWEETISLIEEDSAMRLAS